MKTNAIQNDVGGAPVETEVIIKVGLDAHAVKITACADGRGDRAAWRN